MRFGSPFQQDQPDEIPMAPLIDIVFLTLIFFMVSSVYATLESEVDITLPTASSAAPSDRTQGEIFINLRDDGKIVLNERDVSLEELQGILVRVATFFPGGGGRHAMQNSSELLRKAHLSMVLSAPHAARTR